MNDNDPKQEERRQDEAVEQPKESPTDVPAEQSQASQPSSRNPRKIIIGALLVIVLCFAAGFVGARLFTSLDGSNPLTGRDMVENDGNKIITEEEETISDVVAKVSPSVVSIVTTSQEDSFYGPSLQSGAGSGIIVGKEGYVMTNKHVVNDARTVNVVMTDGTRYEDVRVVGSDPLNDIAFLKIEGVNDLPVAELGDSSSIRVGQKVIAIGNSLGQYQNTVTSGIISGTGRPIAAQDGDSVENLTDLIQTDAAINPGNSGGPLLNLAGQVIGINTAIIEDAQGIGFAIPINATKGILKGVLAGSGVQRAYLGINYVPITGDAVERFDLSVNKGAYVYNGEGQAAVVDGSPADRAGIRSGDIITKVNGVEVGTTAGLSSLVAEYAPGDTIELTLLRDGRETTVRATLTEYRS